MVRPQLGRVGQEIERLGKTRGDVELGRALVLRPHEAEKIGNRFVEALRFFEDDRHQPLLLRRKSFRFAENLDGAGDRRERIADLVRDARRQFADCGHAIFQPQLRFELLHLGEVLEDERVAGCGSFQRLQRCDGVTEGTIVVSD